MKALLGLTTAATLAVGMLGVAPASADHYNNTGTYNGTKGSGCGLDLYRTNGLTGSGVVTNVKVAEPQEGDVSTRYDSYMCRFQGLPSYIPGERTDSGLPYYGPTSKPVTYEVSCMSAFTDASGVPDTIPGTLKVFRNGTALLKCGVGE